MHGASIPLSTVALPCVPVKISIASPASSVRHKLYVVISGIAPLSDENGSCGCVCVVEVSIRIEPLSCDMAVVSTLCAPTKEAFPAMAIRRESNGRPISFIVPMRDADNQTALVERSISEGIVLATYWLEEPAPFDILNLAYLDLAEDPEAAVNKDYLVACAGNTVYGIWLSKSNGSICRSLMQTPLGRPISAAAFNSSEAVIATRMNGKVYAHSYKMAAAATLHVIASPAGSPSQLRSDPASKSKPAAPIDKLPVKHTIHFANIDEIIPNCAGMLSWCGSTILLTMGNSLRYLSSSELSLISSVDIPGAVCCIRHQRVDA